MGRTLCRLPRPAGAGLREWSPAWLPVFAAFCVVALGLDWVVSSAHPFGDDNSAHFALALHISELWSAGESDLWWHQSNVGLPLFAAYQPLPALSMGTLIAVLGDLIAPVVLFKASILGCWALMPLAWYQGARWYGLAPGLAAALGLLTLTIHDPYGIGFGIRSATERGLYTQSFGLLFLPLFVGAFRRQLGDRPLGGLLTASFFVLTTASHLWVGLYAVIIAGAYLLAEPARFQERMRPLLVVLLWSSLMLSWWLIPLLMTNDYAGGLPWRREIHNGWPWRDTIEKLCMGEVYDTSRVPVLTALVGVGVLGLLRSRRGPSVRHWWILVGVTAALFLGRTNLGEAYDWLPLHSQVNVMRYLTGVHICGLVAAASALHALAQWLRPRMKRGFILAVSMVSGSIAWFGAQDVESTLRGFDSGSGPFTELVDYLSSASDHRLAVHGSLRTGNHFHRDLLPSLTDRGQLQSYAHGYHCTLSTYYLEYFDFSPAACGLFDVGSIVARSPVPEDFPADAYEERWEGSKYVVFHPGEQSDLGVFSFVDIRGAIQGPDFRSIRPAVRMLSVPAFSSGVLPRVGTHDSDEVIVTGSDGTSRVWDRGDAGELLDSLVTSPVNEKNDARVDQMERGLSSYTARVTLTGTESRWLILKVNFFPWWEAHVDGEEVSIVHVAPNFMAIEIPPGDHSIEFRYRNPLLQKLGALMALLVMLAGLVSPLWRWLGLGQRLGSMTHQDIRRA